MSHVHLYLAWLVIQDALNALEHEEAKEPRSSKSRDALESGAMLYHEVLSISPLSRHAPETKLLEVELAISFPDDDDHIWKSRRMMNLSLGLCISMMDNSESLQVPVLA